MVFQANLLDSSRDPNIDVIITRFVRSVIRILCLVIILSPVAAGTMISEITSSISSMVTFNVGSEVNPSLELSTSASQAPNASSASTPTHSKEPMTNYRAVAISGLI